MNFTQILFQNKATKIRNSHKIHFFIPIRKKIFVFTKIINSQPLEIL